MAPRRGGVRVPVDGDVTGLERALGQADASLGRFASRTEAFGKKADAAGRTLTRNLTLPIVGAGVAAGKLAFDFQDSMTKVSALVGVSAKQTDAWGKAILDMAPKLGKAPRELADALYFITSSGIPASKTLDALRVSAKLSTAGLGDTQVVADAVTSSINAYAATNMTAAQAGDIFTATVKEGKAEASQLAPVLGNVLPLAADMGVSFDQVGAAIAAMTLKGTDAETAVTNLSAIMASFLKPSVQGAAALKDVGLSAADLRKETRDKGLLATLQTLREKFKGNDEALSKVLPNIRALRGFLQLTGGDAKATEKLFGRLQQTTGQMDKAFEATTKTNDFKLRASFARLQAQGIKVGNVLLPVAADVAGGFADLLDVFDRLPGSAKKAAGAGVILLAGLGPVLRLVGAGARGLGAISKLLGMGGSAASAAAGSLGVQKVYVVNMAPGFGGRGAGGMVPGVVGAGAGAAGGGVSIPGVGAAVGGGAGGIALPAIGLAATIGAGIAVDKLNQRFGFLSPSDADIKREQARTANAMIKAWREGAPAFQRELQKHVSIPAGPLAEQVTEAAKGGVKAIADVFAKDGRTGQSAKTLVGKVVGEMKKLPPNARNYAADSAIQLAGELERKGQLPKGTTKRLVAALSKTFGELPNATRKAAAEVVAGLAPIQAGLDLTSSKARALFDLLASPHNVSPIKFPTLGGLPPATPAGPRGTRKPDAFGEDALSGPVASRIARITADPGIVRRVAGGSPLSASDFAAASIASRHRNDAVQDRRASADAQRAAGFEGITNPDKLALIGERAVVKTRRAEILADVQTVKAGAQRVNAQIRAQKVRKKKALAALGKLHKGDQKYDDQKQRVMDIARRISELYDELNGFIVQAADLRAEAASIGWDIGDLNAEIAKAPNVVPPEPAETGSDTGGTADTGPSPDQQAIDDQLRARAAAFVRGESANAALIGAIGSAGDSGGQHVSFTFVNNGVTTPVEVADWMTQMLGSQGHQTVSVIRSAA